MFIKKESGSCNFVREQKFSSVENAADNKDPLSVEVKVGEVKIDFTTVRREDDESHTEDPKARGHSEEKL
tara:strand:+ start:1458 stop:1667 length:210 start_codon:yes stop_codon:yes gene_type:complete